MGFQGFGPTYPSGHRAGSFFGGICVDRLCSIKLTAVVPGHTKAERLWHFAFNCSNSHLIVFPVWSMLRNMDSRFTLHKT